MLPLPWGCLQPANVHPPVFTFRGRVLTVSLARPRACARDGGPPLPGGRKPLPAAMTGPGPAGDANAPSPPLPGCRVGVAAVAGSGSGIGGLCTTTPRAAGRGPVGDGVTLNRRKPGTRHRDRFGRLAIQPTRDTNRGRNIQTARNALVVRVSTRNERSPFSLCSPSGTKVLPPSRYQPKSPEGVNKPPVAGT